MCLRTNDQIYQASSLHPIYSYCPSLLRTPSTHQPGLRQPRSPPQQSSDTEPIKRRRGDVLLSQRYRDRNRLPHKRLLVFGDGGIHRHDVSVIELVGHIRGISFGAFEVKVLRCGAEAV